MKSFRRGEEAAFDQLFREYFAALSLFAYRLTGDEQQAEDIVQDCFVSLWERRRGLKHIDSIKSYLYTSIRYRCIDNRKKLMNVRLHAEDPQLVQTEGLPDAAIIEAETAALIYQMLEALPARMKTVIKMYYLEGKSYKEIGKILQTEPETVRNQRFKALGLLRKRFIPE